MKYLLAILSFTLLFSTAKGEKPKRDTYRTQIDSSASTGDATFAKVQTYRNDTLIEDCSAFLIPDTIQFPRSRSTFYLIRRKFYAFRLLRHGTSIKYQPDGQKESSEYNYGKEISRRYYSNTNKEIPPSEYRHIMIGPCATRTGEYIIRGIKK